MQMLTREQSKNRSSVSGLKETSGENQQVHTLEDEAQLTKNMNNAMAKLNLSLVNGDQNMEEDVEEDADEIDDAMEREVDSELDTSYVVQHSDLPDLSFEVDPDSDDEEGKDYSQDNLSVHLEDHSLGQDMIPHRKYRQECLTPTMLTRLKSPTLSRSFYGTLPDHQWEA